MIPLFLGADVLALTHVRTENHTKLHAKFAKKGLASKLNFGSEFRFHRLKLPASVNGLWFYSIQGVFRVAFEMYTRDHQLALLDSFQGLWKTRIIDDPLNKVYEISTIHGNMPLQNTTPGNASCLSEAEIYDTLGGLTSEFLYRTHTDDVCNSLNVASAQVVDVCFQLHTEDHNYCFPENRHAASIEASVSRGSIKNPISQKIKSLLCTCETLASDLEKQLEIETVVMLLIEIAELLLKGAQSLMRLTQLIPQLLDHVSCLFSKDSSQKGTLPLYSNKLLFVISSWLGSRFCSENSSISLQVEEFKRGNIDRINDLPPAEELIDALFPEAMKILLINWMGLAGESSTQKLQSEYPILLLILEFANHNLITGVSHVLYSSLICK
ncbi:uncharacterized protein [Ambystoma mexicanum]|uniref:uncharacterized protein n=1 Tax=Ambystoma mexicanum TaxID=8296 RepID=UPI0037E79559